MFLINLTMLFDRFGVISGRPHSCGAVYLVYLDLDRSVRYLQRNVLLVMNIAGPKEPSLEEMNHLLEPFVKEVNILRCGKLKLLGTLQKHTN